MKHNVLKLINVICYAYDRVREPKEDEENWMPHAGKTYCNKVVNLISMNLGYLKFAGMYANAMIDHITDNPQEWMELNIEQAQDMANMGRLVIAGNKNEESGHGHVIVIRPGDENWSNKWQQYCPKCINVGREVFIAQGINWAFINIPKFYMLKDSDLRR